MQKINTKKRVSEYDEDFMGRSNQDLVTRILKENNHNQYNNTSDDKSNRALTTNEIDRANPFATKEFNNISEEDNMAPDIANLIKNQKTEDDFEIRLKEVFEFKVNREFCRFSFGTRNNTEGLEYYRNDMVTNKMFIEFNRLRDYFAVTNTRNGFSGIIQLRFQDRSKANMEMETKDEKDYTAFTNKLGKYISKA